MGSVYDKYNLWGVRDWNLFQAAMHQINNEKNALLMRPDGDGHQSDNHSTAEFIGGKSPAPKMC